MQKEVYADNVDVNGEAHETVGENIRNGAKSPEAVAKALQSEDITFDMQAVMNVLPFMDGTKKMKKVTLYINEGVWHSDYKEINPSNCGCGIGETIYGYIVGEINRSNLNLNKIRFDITASPGVNSNLYIAFNSPLEVNDKDAYIILYVCIMK